MKKVYSFTRKGIDFEVTKDMGMYMIIGSKNDTIVCVGISKTYGDAYKSILKDLENL